jgi:hypothetical protein
MATCARCDGEILDSNVGLSEDSLLMVLIADHMLELFGLARRKRKSSSEEKTFAIEDGLQSWNTFAHFGRICSSLLHKDAHDEGDGSMKPLCDAWLRSAREHCTVGLDRTSSGQRLKGKVPADRFVPQHDSILASQVSEGNLKIQEWR